jgi:transposase
MRKKLQPVCIAIDATGGLEKELAYALAAENLPVAVVNPRQVSNFAKSTGQRAKSDAIDAAVLAHFAEVMKPEVRPLPDAASRESSSTTKASMMYASPTIACCWVSKAR